MNDFKQNFVSIAANFLFQSAIDLKIAQVRCKISLQEGKCYLETNVQTKLILERILSIKEGSGSIRAKYF